MRKDLAAIMVVMDASGSMESLRAGVIDGVNNFVTAQAEVAGHALFSMVQFDSNYNGLNYKNIFDFQNIKEVPKLTRATYQPGGGTPLLDAMAKAIDEFGAKLGSIPESDRPSKVILAVITDGEENSSTHITRSALFEKIKHQQEKYGWQIIYMGANQDSFAEASSFGVSANSTANYASTYGGMTRGLNTLSVSASSYRSGAASTVDMSGYEDEELKKTLTDATKGK